jgi:hypothetical protein
MSTIRQRLVAAVKVRLQGIRTANGFQTEAGANVFVWRVLPLETAELPALIVRDREQRTEQAGRVAHDHSLTVEIEGHISALAPSAEDARALLGDLLVAIGSDPTWHEGGVRLALDTEPLTDELTASHEDRALAGVKLRVTIRYRTPPWNPYSAQK